MALLILGLVLFFSIHAVTGFALRDRLIESLGEIGYKIAFALIAVLGMVMIVYGFGQADYLSVWVPPHWLRYPTMLCVTLAILLLLVSMLPNNFKRLIRHPMLMAFLISYQPQKAAIYGRAEVA
ncbi:MAG: hypothetical protein GY814_00325 [Gammaproteobacteria bacterium]|nr:hypothetical protein [Gammaproteobacteria bacterium]